MRDDTLRAAAARFDIRSRTLMTNIMGFSELLADPSLGLPEVKRLEYAEIVFASSVALAKESAALSEALTAVRTA
jgi:hypothetical protein